MQALQSFTLTATNTHSLPIRTRKAKKPRDANVTLKGLIKDGVEDKEQICREEKGRWGTGER